MIESEPAGAALGPGRPVACSPRVGERCSSATSKPAAYHREGSVYVARRDIVLGQNSLYGRFLLGYLVDGSRSVNLDTPEDWSRAEALLGAVGTR